MQGDLNPIGVPHDRFGFSLRHCSLWNPVGVQDNSNFAPWGAPRCGDPRLCCETRTGLNHGISQTESFTNSKMEPVPQQNCG
jgi:hypothetical protein